MSDTAHTPGPWRAEWLDDENGWIMDAGGRYLAEIVTSDSEGLCVTHDEQVTNANLMAAAPDLLSVLREFVMDVEAVGVESLLVKDDEVGSIEWPDLAITYRRAVEAIGRMEGAKR